MSDDELEQLWFAVQVAKQRTDNLWDKVLWAKLDHKKAFMEYEDKLNKYVQAKIERES